MKLGTGFCASVRWAAWTFGILIFMFSGSVQAMCGQGDPSRWGRDHSPVSTHCTDDECIASATPVYTSTHSIDGKQEGWLCDSPEEAIRTDENKPGQQFPAFCQSLGGSYQGIVQTPGDTYRPTEIDGVLYYSYLGNCGHTR